MKTLAILSALMMMAACAHTKSTTKAPAESAPAAKTTKAAPAAAGAVTCTAKSDVRTIAVTAKDGGCEVHYAKQGKDKVVSSSAHGMKHCEDSAAKIKTHLTGSGYSCK